MARFRNGKYGRPRARLRKKYPCPECGPLEGPDLWRYSCRTCGNTRMYGRPAPRFSTRRRRAPRRDGKCRPGTPCEPECMHPARSSRDSWDY